jgi:acetyl esterase/lipase
VTAFVLKYHTGEIGPAVRAQITEAAQTGAEPPPGVREAEEAARAAVFPKAIADTLRAIRMIRANAAELDLDPSRIGVMGFSAGAYLAVAAGIQGEAGEPSPATDRLARPSSRPDFLCPIYPAVPPELEETTKALPPAFIVQAYDDFLPVEHSLRLYQALRQADVPAEMHLYVKGGHGFGLGVHGGPVASWTDRFADWLTVMFLS